MTRPLVWEVVSKDDIELLADQGKNYDAEGKNTRQPGHGSSGWNECSQTEEQEKQNGTPTSDCLGHVHFLLLLNKVTGRTANLNMTTPVPIKGYERLRGSKW